MNQDRLAKLRELFAVDGGAWVDTLMRGLGGCDLAKAELQNAPAAVRELGVAYLEAVRAAVHNSPTEVCL